MDNENKNINEENVTEEPAVVVEKKKKRFIKPLIICVSILVALAIVGVAVYAVLAQFVLFPSFASALGNTLEAKLDIGTEFRVDKLIDGGKITVEAEGMDGKTEDASFTLSYNKNGYVASTVLDRYEIDIAMTDKGMAYSSNKLNDGESYGISFKNIEETLENSALYYRNDGDYALTKDEFKAKLKTLEALAEDDERIKKDLLIICSEFAKAFDESEMSEYEVAYGGIKMNGETRKARAQIYSFTLKDLTHFLSDAAERFEDPSTKVEEAVERLAKTEVAALIGDYLGYRVSDCDDLSELLDKIADSLKANFDGAKFNFVVGYVGRAVSVIQIKITKDGDPITLTLDFGENPTQEYKIGLSVENTVGNEKTKVYVGYDVIETDDGLRAKARVGNYIYSDVKNGYYEMEGSEIYLDFNHKEGEVSFVTETVEEKFGRGLEKAAVWRTVESEALFEYTDSKNELTLELKKVTEGGKDTTPKGDYRIIISTKPDSVKLPKYEKVFNMSERDYEDYRGDVADFLKDLKTDEYDGMGMIPENFDLSQYFK